MELILKSIFIMLMLIGLNGNLYADSVYLDVTAEVVPTNQIKKVNRKTEMKANDQSETVYYGVQVGGTPLIILNIDILGTTLKNNGNGQMVYILNEEGKVLINIDPETFYKDRIGTMGINY